MMSMFDVSNKTILIVGASSGIGESFAKTLAKQGAKLLIAARRLDRLQALKTELLQLGANGVETYQVDVTQYDQVQALLASIEAGKQHIEVSIVCAGTNIRKPLTEYSEADWNTVRAINLDGNWWVSQAVAKHMMQHKIPGSIIHISSMIDKRALTLSSHAYQATKAAVHQLTKSMAAELAPHNIRVNTIAPGFFTTDLNRDLVESKTGEALFKAIPFGRPGDLSEMDGPLLLLCSDASSYMSGSVIRVDGGCASDHIPVIS